MSPGPKAKSVVVRSVPSCHPNHVTASPGSRKIAVTVPLGDEGWRVVSVRETLPLVRQLSPTVGGCRLLTLLGPGAALGSVLTCSLVWD